MIGAIVSVAPATCLKMSLFELLDRAFNMFEQFGSLLEDFETKVSLVNLLVAIQSKQTLEAQKKLERKKISNICHKILQQKWKGEKIRTDHVTLLFKHFIKKSESPLQSISKFTKSVFPTLEFQATSKKSKDDDV